jgi:hypothetical protein
MLNKLEAIVLDEWSYLGVVLICSVIAFGCGFIIALVWII